MIKSTKINTVELSGAYTQKLMLPDTTKMLDVVRRGLHGVCAYTLVYEYEYDSLHPYNIDREYEIVFNSFGYETVLDKSYEYLTSVADESGFSHYMVHGKRILTEADKRELKIDHLLSA